MGKTIILVCGGGVGLIRHTLHSYDNNISLIPNYPV